MELQRHLGVTYKCAWRMCNQIRLLMQQKSDQLSGIVEIDETYIGGKRKGNEGKFDNKTAVIGIVEKRKGSGQVKEMCIRDRHYSGSAAGRLRYATQYKYDYSRK